MYVCMYVHVLNYTRNINKKSCIPNTRKHSQAHFQDRYQTLENKIVFKKTFLRKMAYFSENINTETNRTLLSMKVWHAFMGCYLAQSMISFPFFFNIFNLH